MGLLRGPQHISTWPPNQPMIIQKCIQIESRHLKAESETTLISDQ